MDDLLDEESQIANEQDSTKTLSSDIFEGPISNLPQYKAICLDESATLEEAIKTMQNKKIGSVLITNNGQLTGIITERDILLKVTGVVTDLAAAKVRDYMTEDPQCLRSEDMIAYVMNNMHVGGYRHVPIVDDNGIPLTVISIKNVMTFILDYFPEHITNIQGEPFRGPVSRESA